METKFQGFKMLMKRQILQESKYDLNLTSAYISLSTRAMKHLDINVGDKVAFAACTDGVKSRMLIARSNDARAYPIVVNKKVKATTPIVFAPIGKNQPELKGNYYLKEYGKNNGHFWWELTKESPDKEESPRRIKFF